MPEHDPTHPSAHKYRILDASSTTIRSLTCHVDPPGTTSHECRNADGRYLYHPGEECNMSARLDVAREMKRKSAELALHAQVNRVFLEAVVRDALADEQRTEHERTLLADIEAEFGVVIWPWEG